MNPIETRWAGWRFRSRLEARWAVFFNAMGIRWEYEPEAFPINRRQAYLPDFRARLRMPDGAMDQCWAEVKPEAFTPDERAKCESLTIGTKQPVLMLVGQPDYTPYEMLYAGSHTVYDPNNDIEQVEHHAYSHPYLLPSSQNKDRLWCEPEADDIENLRKCPRYAAAVEAARSARFEFGEKPTERGVYA